VDLPVDVSMRIVDDLGQVVSRTGPGDDMVLGFYPDADYYFQRNVSSIVRQL
jgi:hypothetical protein